MDVNNQNQNKKLLSFSDITLYDILVYLDSHRKSEEADPYINELADTIFADHILYASSNGYTILH